MKPHKRFILHRNIQFIQAQTACHCPGFAEFNINANHLQLLEGKPQKNKSMLFCGPAKNLRGLVPVRVPAVENHCLRWWITAFYCRLIQTMLIKVDL